MYKRYTNFFCQNRKNTKPSMIPANMCIGCGEMTYIPGVGCLTCGYVGD